MSSVLTYDVVCFVHHVAYDIAHDVCIDSNSGVRIACSGPEWPALHLQVLFFLVPLTSTSAPTATIFNSYARPPPSRPALLAPMHH
jgi:hypothetical protein